MLMACLTAAKAATSLPMTRTLAGGTFPADVVCPVKNRPKWFDAFTTALKSDPAKMSKRDFKKLNWLRNYSEKY